MLVREIISVTSTLTKFNTNRSHDDKQEWFLDEKIGNSPNFKILLRPITFLMVIESESMKIVSLAGSKLKN